MVVMILDHRAMVTPERIKRQTSPHRRLIQHQSAAAAVAAMSEGIAVGRSPPPSLLTSTNAFRLGDAPQGGRSAAFFVEDLPLLARVGRTASVTEPTPANAPRVHRTATSAW